MPATSIDPRNCYRMPWSLTDNAMSWMEVTTRCNLACKGCYRDPRKDGHKTLEEIREELEVFKRVRKSDGMSLAGGDPLVHPQIVEIVRMVREAGYKPLINTNGLGLTPELLHDLRKAGAASFTFHVDTTQKRRDCPAETEMDYTPLREKYAAWLKQEGGLTCGYNITVTRQRVHEVPELVRWAERNADRVHSIHFIPYRDFGVAPHLDLFANGRRIEVDENRVHSELAGEMPMGAEDIFAQVRIGDPQYEPSAYLSGSCDPESMKWTFATRYVLNGRTIGYAGPRLQEIAQQFNHLQKGKWLAITTPRIQASGKGLLTLLSPFDRGTRRTAWEYVKAVFRNPLNLFRRVRLQTILVLQAIDYLPDGRMNMCDGCPDMMVHKGKLYWSCRLEEIKEYGTFLTAAPRDGKVADYRRKFFHEVAKP